MARPFASATPRRYFTWPGFTCGRDGALDYAPEAIGEIYYRFEIPGHLNCSLSPDYQFVLYPAYNRARGPVHVVALRFHVEI